MGTEEKRKLPAILDLYEEKGLETLDRRNQLNVLLNQAPAQSWIKTHPTINGYKYLPIERIEYLLTRIFVKWKVEVKTVQLIGNSVVVVVRLHYLDPVDGKWDYQDGIGGAPLQTDKGAGAIEFDKLKAAAVMMAAPAAETFAVKDAADKLGKLFGKDLNRKEVIAYDSMTTNFTEKASVAELKNDLSGMLSHCQDNELRDDIVNEVMVAERAKVATSDFYSRMISKLRRE
jgi:hypothetical protein